VGDAGFVAQLVGRHQRLDTIDGASLCRRENAGTWPETVISYHRLTGLSTDERMGSNYLEDFAIWSVNSSTDSLEDAVYSTGSGQFQIYSGADGAILYQANIGYERRAALMECDGDAAYEVVAGTGPSFLRLSKNALTRSIIRACPKTP